MAGITWLHLSDWHQKGTEFDRQVVRDALLKDIEGRTKISSDLEQVNFIAFSGDVTYSGSPQEYHIAIEQFFEPIIKAAGVPRDRLFIVPGNHDLDLGTFKYLPASLLNPLNTNKQVQDWLADQEGLNYILLPFRGYNDFVKDYMNSGQTAYSYFRKFEIGGKRISILGLNSALLSGRHKEIRDGKESINDDRFLVLGEPQFYNVLQNREFCECDVCIAIMHHPFDWLIEFDRELVSDKLTKSCHFILQGHEHRPKVTIASGTSGECMIIPAGPSYDRRDPEISRCANSYNYVHLVYCIINSFTTVNFLHD
jgi:hypothetical protein